MKILLNLFRNPTIDLAMLFLFAVQSPGREEAVRRRLWLFRTYGGRKPDEARRAKTWPNPLLSGHSCKRSLIFLVLSGHRHPLVAVAKAKAVLCFVAYKKIVFLFLLFSFSQCAASWSPISSIYNFFESKEYTAIQDYKKQDYEQSLANFHDLMNDDPYNPEYNYNVGNLLYRQKKYADAQQAFSRAVEHAKKSSKLAEQALFNCGNSCYQLKQWQDAVTAYQNVLQIDENNESARHNLELALHQLREQQQQQQNKDKSADTKNKDQQQQNKDKSDQNQDGSQDNSSCAKAPADKQSGGDDSSDSGGQDEQNGQKQQQGNDKNQQQKSGSKKNNEGQGKDEGGKSEDSGSTDKGDEKGKNQDQKSQEKSAEKNQQGKGEGSDDQNGQSDEMDMNESGQEKSDSKKSSQNRLQSSGTDGQDKDDATQQFNQTQGPDYEQGKEDVQAGREDQGEGVTSGNDKKQTRAIAKKPELKNQLQDQYESKASDDERLTDYHKDVMKTLEDLEKNVQKHIIKNKVAQQGAGQGGKNGW